eukprot:TRINITY_DN40146_c0_g1_i1.p1 TRINITY_DN40146_c0_g1~~TRINITY_DN40146_c0_g1_i1.p1  ORF type:complete len:130 (+),score=5.84 TRINITY_DN40146_c0_g1_i1:458-847(+)
MQPIVKQHIFYHHLNCTICFRNLWMELPAKFLFTLIREIFFFFFFFFFFCRLNLLQYQPQSLQQKMQLNIPNIHLSQNISNKLMYPKKVKIQFFTQLCSVLPVSSRFLEINYLNYAYQIQSSSTYDLFN